MSRTNLPRLLTGMLLLTTGLARAEPATVLVRPGRAVGDIHIGMDQGALLRKGFVAKAQMRDWFDKGPYSVRAEGGKVSIIEFNSGAACVRFEGGKAPCQGPGEPFTALAERIGSCGPLDSREGGTIIACAGGLKLQQTLEGVAVRVEAPGRIAAPAVVCQAYAGREGGKRTVVLQPGRTYCVDGDVLSTESPLVMPRDRPCEVVVEGSERVLRCAHRRLFFDGPSGKLRRVQHL